MKADDVALLGLGALALFALASSGGGEAAPAGDAPITDPARIAAVQEALASLGYHPGFGRGSINTPTLSALSQFLTDQAGTRMEAAAIDPYFERLVLDAAAARAETAPPEPSAPPVAPAPPAPPEPSAPSGGGSLVGPIMDPYGGAVVTNGTRISAVQTSLRAMGFDPGPIDGRVGTRTLAATNAWIALRGAPGSGEVRSITEPLALAILTDAQRGYRRPASVGDLGPDRAVRVAAVAAGATRRRY